MTAPSTPRLSGPAALALFACGAWPAIAAATPADDVLQCKTIDFKNCPALLLMGADRQGAVATLAQALAAPASAPDVRARAAQALLLLDARDHLDAFATAAKAVIGLPEEVDVLAAMARLGDAGAVPRLLVLLDGPDERAQSLAASNLGLLRAKDATPRLLAKLKAPTAPRVTAAAAQALGFLGDKAALAPLIELAGAPEAYGMARVHALDALAAIGDPTAVVVATLSIDAPKRDIGRAALRVLRAMPTAWALPALDFALDTPGLRAEACRAVAAGHVKALGAKLVHVMTMPDLSDDDRLWLWQALAAIKPAGAGPALLKAFQAEPNGPRKLAALRSLAEVGDRTVVPALLPLLRDPDKLLTDHVVTALERLTGENLGPDERLWRKFADGAEAVPSKAKAPDPREAKPLDNVP
ncbi:MAG: HEAT repeat domain-containing protein [Myxococcales bacterium]|nr:HEAT repeat domain-containing protein [Myxococcales bacterium]